MNEKQLIGRIRQLGHNPEGTQRRLDELMAKNRDEQLAPGGKEHHELIRLTDECERRRAERMAMLSELAKLRKTTLDEVMRDFDFSVPAHG
jgi:hypothetical protein